MTDVDESLLTAAKLREQIKGRVEGDSPVLDHTGVVPDPAARSSLSFLNQMPEFTASSLKTEVTNKIGTDTATEAVHSGNSSVLSHFVGVTEQDLAANSLTLPVRLLDRMDNYDAPCFTVLAGNPNTGKTNLLLLLAQLRKYEKEDLLILSNFNSSITDIVVTSTHDLAISLLENRDRPKFVMVDEASTHFDSRTNRRPVAVQWTPLAKRFAKLNVDVAGLVCHTGKDLHPEAKRLATLPIYKPEKKTAEIYDRWPSDSEAPEDLSFSGPLEDLEKAAASYDPDAAAPWSWNLKADLFSENLSWSQLLETLRVEGPDLSD